MAQRIERRHPRVPASLSVTIKVKGGAKGDLGRIENISLGGVFVEMREPLPFGIDLDLEFSLSDAMGVIRCKGFVVWTTKGAAGATEDHGGKQGVGIRLTDIGVKEMRLLAGYIDSQLPKK